MTDAKIIFFGEFQHGKKHGHGITIWNDGSFYYGQYADNHKDGQGVFVGSDKKAKFGLFVKDKPEGEIVIVLPNGHCRQVLYKEGGKHTIAEQSISPETDEDAKVATEYVS